MSFKSLLFLSLFTPAWLGAATLSGHYDITFSVFGKIGEADVSMTQEGERYHIHIDGRLTGLAADLANNRREAHDSYGRIVDGVFLPERYVKVRSTDTRNDTLVYTFDHHAKSVLKSRTKEYTRTESRFDISKMGMVEIPRKVKHTSEAPLPYYAANDLLSLFFNVRHYLKEIPEGEQSVRHSVGAANSEGKILITNPSGEKRRMLAELMPDNEDRLITVVVDQDIFESEKGELFINLDADYLVIEAMLKDVLLFGDIRAKRTSHRSTH